MTTTRPKNSRLMIAVLPDETSAFRAYLHLRDHGISLENLALVGKGYSSLENVGLLEPKRMAWRYAKQGLIKGGLIGTVLGTILHLITNLRLSMLSWGQTLLAVAIASGLVGSIIGAILGTAYGLIYKSSTSIACRNCLRRGQYLLLLEGSETLTRRGREILNKYTIKPD